MTAIQSGTKELFMGQLQEEMEKEMQEFLDAKNKEVLVTELALNISVFAHVGECRMRLDEHISGGQGA